MPNACGFEDCSRCRAKQALVEHRRRLKADLVGTDDYAPEEHLINIRVGGARRRGDYR